MRKASHVTHQLYNAMHQFHIRRNVEKVPISSQIPSSIQNRSRSKKLHNLWTISLIAFTNCNKVENEIIASFENIFKYLSISKNRRLRSNVKRQFDVWHVFRWHNHAVELELVETNLSNQWAVWKSLRKLPPHLIWIFIALCAMPKAVESRKTHLRNIFNVTNYMFCCWLNVPRCLRRAVFNSRSLKCGKLPFFSQHR